MVYLFNLCTLEVNKSGLQLEKNAYFKDSLMIQVSPFIYANISLCNNELFIYDLKKD